MDGRGRPSQSPASGQTSQTPHACTEPVQGLGPQPRSCLPGSALREERPASPRNPARASVPSRVSQEGRRSAHLRRRGLELLWQCFKAPSPAAAIRGTCPLWKVFWGLPEQRAQPDWMISWRNLRAFWVSTPPPRSSSSSRLGQHPLPTEAT